MDAKLAVEKLEVMHRVDGHSEVMYRYSSKRAEKCISRPGTDRRFGPGCSETGGVGRRVNGCPLKRVLFKGESMILLKRVISVSVILTWLITSGCASAPSREVQEKKAQFESTIPVCEGEADCKAKWEAAQLWVVHNAGFKIQTATDVLIETYNPGPSAATVAVRVTKEPLGGGKYKIIAVIWCNNIFGCVPNVWNAALDFNREVGAVKP
jgi:hypothetical protein